MIPVAVRSHVPSALAVAAPVAVAAVIGLAHAPMFVLAVIGAMVVGVAIAAWGWQRFGPEGLWFAALPLAVLAGQLGSVGAGGQSGRILVLDVVAFVGVLFAVVRGAGVVEVPRTRLVAWLALFIAWAVVGTIGALDPLTAIAEIKEWGVAAVVAAAATAWVRDTTRVRFVVGALVAASVAIALGMMVATATHPAGPVLAVLMKQVDLPWGRSNYLAGFLILALPLAIGAALSSRSRREGWVWAVAAVVCGVGLALSASKGAMLALVLTALPVFALGGRGTRRAALLFAVLVGLLVFAFVAGPLREVMEYRLQTSAIDYSMNERLDLYRLGWRSFMEHSLTGLGLNNFSVASHQLRGLDTVPHQLVLGLLAEVGLPGTVLAMGFMLLPLVAGWRRWRHATDPAERAMAAGLLAAWAGMLAHNQVESTVYGGQFKLFLVLLAVVLTCRDDRREKGDRALAKGKGTAIRA